MYHTDVYREQKDIALSEEKNYIISVNSTKQLERVENNYNNSDVINENANGCLEENNMIPLSLDAKELSDLSANKNIDFIEEDLIMTASIEENGQYHQKQIEEIELQ